MKKSRSIQAGMLSLAIIAGLSFTAVAQTPAPDSFGGLPHLQATDLRQYPSVIQISGDATGGRPNTKFTLRCGYMMDGQRMVLDPTDNDLLMSNSDTHAYTRYQYIDGKPVLSNIDVSKPSMGNTTQLLFQVTESDGSIKAKSCSVNLQTDKPQSCVPAQPFMSADQSNAAVAALAKQCSDLMSQSSSQINADVYSAEKTQMWKANLHQTLMILEQ